MSLNFEFFLTVSIQSFFCVRLTKQNFVRSQNKPSALIITVGWWRYIWSWFIANFIKLFLGLWTTHSSSACHHVNVTQRWVSCTFLCLLKLKANPPSFFGSVGLLVLIHTLCRKHTGLMQMKKPNCEKMCTYFWRNQNTYMVMA